MSAQTRIRADFSRPVTVRFDEVEWTPSPSAGVHRKMLDRVGDEVARATSIVRYEAGSTFDEHEHGGGEEILVLDGVFSDETGDYPAGTYLRNPPGSRHAPGSEPGCIIFVKLWQFQPGDERRVARKTDDLDWLDAQPGTSFASLHAHRGTDVRWVRLDADTRLSLPSEGGVECLVFDGEVRLDDEPMSRWDWTRARDGDPLSLVAQTDALLYVKSGHLTGPELNGPVEET